MRIDAHHHFWRYDPVEYGWIDDAMSSIRRDFLPANLAAATARAGIDSVISVQARQTEEETRWLLELATANAFIAGVVGWLPLCSEEALRSIESFAAHPKLVGLRHVIQGEPDPAFILRPDFNRGVALLKTFDLTYDVLVVERQLPAAIEFVDRHPQQRFVLDHMAKPRIREGRLSPWRENLRELARRPNVWCKLSGVVTEADYGSWTEDSIRPYLETALEAFGPKRLMFGSDWPVCLVACDYLRWSAVASRFVATLSCDEQEQFWYLNAETAYALGRIPPRVGGIEPR
jgi:L-fuconolactonase